MTDCKVEESIGPRKPKVLFDKIVINAFSVSVFVSSILLTVIIATATLARYVFKADLYGYEEWVKLFAFWLYFSGAAIGAFNGSHITADIVEAYVPEGTFKRFLAVLRNTITVGVNGLFVYFGYDFFMFGFRGPLGTGIALPMTTVWRIPLWTSYLAIFLGLSFMLYYFSIELLKSLKALFRGGQS